VPVRLIKHEIAPDFGSFEVRFSDGRESVFFYWDDVAGRRLRPEQATSIQALERAKEYARSRS
jgi:hypothetical protein